MSHCAARTACPHFGLLVGQQAGLQAFGMVGLLVKSAPDVGAALRNLVRYFHLQVRGATADLTVDGDLAVLSYAIYQPQAEGTEQVGDAAIAIAFNIMRELCGPDWMPIEIRFAHQMPDDVGPFRQFFRVPLRFDAEQYAVLFSATWLARERPETDSELRRLVQAEIVKLEKRHGDDFPEQLRSVLRNALLTGHASADQIAAFFSMQRRTLHRRLSLFGTCFQEVRDEVRFEIARQLLEDTSMDIAQIAVVLDYADASAFTRAFRRWSGATPARWRASR